MINSDVYEIYMKVLEKTKISIFFDKEDIIEHGFKYVTSNTEIIGDKSYLCQRIKLIPITKRVEFMRKYDDDKITDVIRKLGYTHIKSVELHSFPFYFDTSSSQPENAVTLILTGFTK